MRVDYWGGPKGMLAPPLKLLGGGAGPPCPPPPSSYAYALLISAYVSGNPRTRSTVCGRAESVDALSPKRASLLHLKVETVITCFSVLNLFFFFFLSETSGTL